MSDAYNYLANRGPYYSAGTNGAYSESSWAYPTSWYDSNYYVPSRCTSLPATGFVSEAKVLGTKYVPASGFNPANATQSFDQFAAGVANGPVAIAMYVTSEFMSYGSGYFDCGSATP